ncbi:MAG TPA: hypothetical protein VF334_19410 [Polyangia bacterium]
MPLQISGAPEICNGIDDACAGAGFQDGKDDCGKAGTGNATKPTCCGGSGCKDTTSDFGFCGSCTPNTCSATTADRCYMSSCSCGMSGAPCGPGLTCQAGMCVAGNGATCSMNTQCQSGFCVDGHCCGVSSCGTCAACTGANGTCVAQAAGAAGNLCPDSNGNTVCDGAAYPNSKCKKNLGQACGAGSECFNGRCVDGYCCNSNCTGQCQACNVGGSLGTCSPVTGAPVSPRMACNATDPMCAGSCNGVNTAMCTYPGGGTACPSVCTPGSGNMPAKVAPAACNSNGACATGSAVNCANGTTKCNATNDGCLAHCASDNDCISSDYCSSSGGGTCTSRHINGASCTAEDCQMSPCNYCASGNCVATGECCQQTMCTGHACADSGNATASQQTISDCMSGMCTPTVTSCGTYLCDPGTNLCRSTCTADADCLTGNYCDSTGHCVMEKAAGSMCAPATECYMGNTMCRECVGDKKCTGGNC